MFNAGAIMGTLGLDASGFTRGMLQAQGMAQIFPSIVTNFMANPLLGFIDLARQAMRALVDLFSASAAAADNIGDLATNVGVTTEFLSGFGLVAQQAGSSVEAVGDALKFLGRNSAEAAAGNKDLRETFARMGISITDASGALRPVSELMLEVSDALAALPEGGERSRVAMELLGRSGVDMIATLSQGSAAIKEQMRVFDQYGATVSKVAAESGDKWQDTMGELMIAYQGFKNMIGERLRDALLPYLQSLLDWVRTHPQEIRAKAMEIAEAVAGAATTAAAAIEALMGNLRAFMVVLGALGTAKAAASVGAMFGPAGAVVAGVGGAIVGGVSTYMATSSPAVTNNYNAEVTVQGGRGFDAREMSDAMRVKWDREQAARTATQRINLGM